MFLKLRRGLFKWSLRRRFKEFDVVSFTERIDGVSKVFTGTIVHIYRSKRGPEMCEVETDYCLKQVPLALLRKEGYEYIPKWKIRDIGGTSDGKASDHRFDVVDDLAEIYGVVRNVTREECRDVAPLLPFRKLFVENYRVDVIFPTMGKGIE